MALVLGFHAVPALVAAYWLGPTISTPAEETAIFIDMAPPAAPPVPPSEQPPGPKQVKAETPQPKLVRDPVKTPPLPNPTVALPVQPPEPPREEAKQAAPQTTAPPARPAPPAPVLSSGVPTWQGLVLGALNKVKRYPFAAQSRRQQGVPYIRFVMDRNGRVVSSRLERSSGFAMLDNEAVNLPRRAQPLPKPPADVTGDTIELVVPVEFYLR
ncbi:energy transducer TonB family protein [Sphingobium chlorophenolicum]|uniref:energy transducer TonB family protein n=1 Tax=Sphingobium chlorophenolicum TaxID=46429 RepID=UPI0020D23C59|nr:energy transducer TonB [Sphingobium chlorophenolicum]